MIAYSALEEEEGEEKKRLRCVNLGGPLLARAEVT